MLRAITLFTCLFFFSYEAEAQSFTGRYSGSVEKVFETYTTDELFLADGPIPLVYQLIDKAKSVTVVNVAGGFRLKTNLKTRGGFVLQLPLYRSYLDDLDDSCLRSYSETWTNFTAKAARVTIQHKTICDGGDSMTTRYRGKLRRRM